MLNNTRRAIYNSNKSWQLLAAKVLCSICIIFSAQVVNAQPSNMRISHDQRSIQSLPYPGALFPIDVELLNTRSVSEKIRLLGSLDGKVFDTTSSESQLDARDRAVYRFYVPSPRSDLTYRFILYGSQGELIQVTDEYRIRRDCVVDTTIDVDIDPDKPLGAQLKTLNELSTKIGYEIDTYERINSVLDELEILIEGSDE